MLALNPMSMALQCGLTPRRRDASGTAPDALDPTCDGDAARLARLAADPAIDVIDTTDAQLDELVRGRTPKVELSSDEVRTRVKQLLAGADRELFGCWFHYPWASCLVHVLPPTLHRELRLDRNRYKITSAEQTRLLSARVAIAGLSVGRAVLSTLIREGIGGSFHLADFDALSVSNLNRCAGGVLDVGIDKTVLAAREVAELDPWLKVRVFRDGVSRATLAEFLEGVDILVEECDDLAMKFELREAARARRIPVLMATSDCGRLDIERFDLEATREPLHGILPGVRAADLAGLTTKQKVPYILRLIDADRLEPRMAASLVEVKETLSTWPQLASGVALGGAMVANAARRLLLGGLEWSGRHSIDLDALLVAERTLPLPEPRPWTPRAVALDAPALGLPVRGLDQVPSPAELRFLVECATLAPSGGNNQPWRFEIHGGHLRCALNPGRRKSCFELAERADVLALGSALEATLIGARALGFSVKAEVAMEPSPWSWSVQLARGGPPERTDALEQLRQRCTNRRTTPSALVSAEDLDALLTAAAQHLALRATAISDVEALRHLGEVIGGLDRARFLSPPMHAELVSEIRWTPEETVARRDGIDLACLELDATDRAAFEVLRSGAAMEVLANLGLGHALGDASRRAFENAGAALILATSATDHRSIVEAGRGLIRVWLAATARGLAVHPSGTPLIFPREFGRQVPILTGAQPLLVLRLSRLDAPSARSLRRKVDDLLVTSASDKREAPR